jgi:hypothetical protein
MYLRLRPNFLPLIPDLGALYAMGPIFMKSTQTFLPPSVTPFLGPGITPSTMVCQVERSQILRLEFRIFFSFLCFVNISTNGTKSENDIFCFYMANVSIL